LWDQVIGVEPPHLGGRSVGRAGPSAAPIAGGTVGSGDTGRVRHGSPVVQREVLEGYVWSAVPVIEVELADSDERIGLYRARGTECWWPSHPPDEHRQAHLVTQRALPWQWKIGLLTIARPGDDYSVSLMWDEGWQFWGWYVDIVRPYRPTPIGWDFMDLHLDLVVAPDLTATLKDADQLAATVEVGQISPDEARAAHRRCEQLAELAARGDGIFGEPFPEWRPDPRWPVPRLSLAAGRALAESPTPADQQLELDWWLQHPPPTDS
jgi:uncharacterized protein